MATPFKPKPITVFSTPRERFLSNILAFKAHRGFVDNDAFIESMEAVKAEYTRKLANETDISNAAAQALKLKGMQDFCFLFMTFTEDLPPPPRPPDTDNLKSLDQRR